MNNPKIALVGYGKMGKAIETIALQKSFEITGIFDINDHITNVKNLDFDIAIDFTNPEVVLSNVKYLISQGKNVIIGTTGWYDQMDSIRELTEKYNVGVVWGSNFSIGMQFFMQIASKASELLTAMDEFNVGIIDIHHINKLDAPSGTAHTLANIIIENNPKYSSLTLDSQESVRDNSKLPVTSMRLGNVIGEHTVKIDSPYEEIELTHSAKNRYGFANGVLLAANWLHNKRGFYSFDKVLESLWQKK